MKKLKYIKTERVKGSIEKIIGEFRKHNYTPEEACSALCMASALVIKMLADNSPSARGKEEQLAEELKKTILANYALLQSLDAPRAAGEA